MRNLCARPRVETLTLDNPHPAINLVDRVLYSNCCFSFLGRWPVTSDHNRGFQLGQFFLHMGNVPENSLVWLKVKETGSPIRTLRFRCGTTQIR